MLTGRQAVKSEDGILMEIEKQDRTARDAKAGEFVSLLTAQQTRIYAYILSLVPNFSDADDILQDTTKIMWERFDDFKHGTDFLAWAKKIAYLLIMKYYRDTQKKYAAFYDEQLIAKLDADSHTLSASFKDYHVHLRHCLKKLKHKDRNLLQLRYYENQKVREMASRFGCSVQYIYRNISRIHQFLLACIQKQQMLKDLS